MVAYVQSRSTPEKFPFPICGYGVMFLKGLEQMVGVAFVDVFNPDFIDGEPKNNWAPFVAPESESFGCFVVVVFGEADAKNIVC